MKLIIAAALAASAITSIAAPALAQPYGPPAPQQQQYAPPPHQYGPPPPADHYGPPAPIPGDVNQRINWMHTRIVQGRMNGSLNRFQADRAQAELDNIRHEEQRDRYYRGGRLIRAEQAHLMFRLDQLDHTLHGMSGGPRHW